MLEFFIFHFAHPEFYGDSLAAPELFTFFATFLAQPAYIKNPYLRGACPSSSLMAIPHVFQASLLRQ